MADPVARGVCLSARRVTKLFGGLVAVDSVTLDIPERTIFSVIGPNGAGKTTFFNCITGLYTPEEGDILFYGHSLVGYRPDSVAAMGIARTYQNIRLFAGMTAMENVLVGQHVNLHSGVFGAIFRPASTVHEEGQAHEEAREMLAFMGLAGRGDMLAASIPYGDQRCSTSRPPGSTPARCATSSAWSPSSRSGTASASW